MSELHLSDPLGVNTFVSDPGVAFVSGAQTAPVIDLPTGAAIDLPTGAASGRHAFTVISPVSDLTSDLQMRLGLRRRSDRWTTAELRLAYEAPHVDWMISRPPTANQRKQRSKLRIAEAAGAGIAEIVFVLDALGMSRTAKRVSYLAGLHVDDEDEPAVDPDSLCRLVCVMIDNPEWGEPTLMLSDEGYAHAEWKTEGGGISMTFLPSGRVDYAAISAPATSPGDVLNIGGHHIEEEAIIGLRWFTDRIVAR